jgi:ribosomal-protein-alanine N-acetyltransferase
VYRIDPMTQEDVAEVGRVERRCFSNPWPASAYRRELQAPDQNFYVVLRQAPADPAPGPGAAVPAGAGGGASDGIGRPGNGAHGDGTGRAVPRRTLLPIGFGRRPDAAGSGVVGALRASIARPERAPVVGFAGMWVLYDEAHITTIGVEPAHRGRGLGELLLVAMFDEALRRGATWLTLEVRVSNEPALALYRKYGFAVHGTRQRYYSDNNEDAHVMWSRSLQDPAYRAELAALRQALLDRLEPSAIGYQLSASKDRRSSAGD